MKVTYNWLKDFVDIKIPARELADKLTMAGLEVTSFEERGQDYVFEIEITSNRPDWLSVVGIAREISAITGAKLSNYTRRKADAVKKSESRKTDIIIKLEDKKDCPLYHCAVIDGVKVGPSPEWLKKRLESIGCRSVNNIVDITNYCLFTYGQPLHAFDLDKLMNGQAGQPANQLEIIVRRANEKEEIISIDGEKRALDESVLVIAAAQAASRPNGRPVAIAGVMGGKESEVSEGTKNILLEAAVFNPLVIRRSRQKAGLQSESSYRFERGVDLENTEFASWQAQNMISQIAGGSLVLAKSCGTSKAEKRQVSLNNLHAARFLGAEITPKKIEDYLTSLGFKVKASGKGVFKVGVPSFRQDVRQEIDLVEEVARVYGFENIPSSLPRNSFNHITNFPETRNLVRVVRNTLCCLGLNEVITYSLIDADDLGGIYKADNGTAEVENPLSKEQSKLRPTLISGLLKCVASNLNQKESNINIFETANVFLKEASGLREEMHLGIALCGARSLLLASGQVREELGFLHLKGIIERLFGLLGIKEYSFQDNGKEISMLAGDKRIGALKKIGGDVSERFDIKNKDVFILEISLEKILPLIDLTKKFKPLPLYPAISRDISLVIKEDIGAGQLLEAIRNNAGPLLKDVKVTDYYKGSQIPSGFRGLTISCLYRSEERTLTEEEVSPSYLSICSLLAEKFGATVRRA